MRLLDRRNPGANAAEKSRTGCAGRHVIAMPSHLSGKRRLVRLGPGFVAPGVTMMPPASGSTPAIGTFNPLRANLASPRQRRALIGPHLRRVLGEILVAS